MNRIVSTHCGKKAAVNLEAIQKIVGSGKGLSELWESSPWPIDHNDPKTEEIINTLFPGDPLLCCALSPFQFFTRKKSHLYKLHDLQFIVPSPMSAKTGRTQEGKISEHTLENTGPRRFLVVEFDKVPIDEQAALLLDLGEKAPLALAVYSGNKSLHGWFYAKAQPEDRLRHFMNYAESLGADHTTWTRSQFVRMPDGLRDNSTRQSVYFFNPEVIR